MILLFLKFKNGQNKATLFVDLLFILPPSTKTIIPIKESCLFIAVCRD